MSSLFLDYCTIPSRNFLRGDSMAKILLKRIPKKTDKANQQRAMRVWSATIVEAYSKEQTIPIINASKYKISNGAYVAYSPSKK